MTHDVARICQAERGEKNVLRSNHSRATTVRYDSSPINDGGRAVPIDVMASCLPFSLPSYLLSIFLSPESAQQNCYKNLPSVPYFP